MKEDLSMLTFYVAVGGFESKTVFGARRPVLLKAGRKYDVSLPQFVLWSSLLWNIHHYDELKAIYEKKMAEAQIRETPPFDEILREMIKRGLIASGCGYTGAEALYELFAKLFLVPVRTSLRDKIFGFLYLTFIRRLPFRITRRLFGRPPLSPGECAVWKLITQHSMSTAELIRCAELEVADVSNGSKVMDALYNAGDGVDFENISVYARFSDKRTAVIDAVANLYLKKQLLFECC
jgi:hypothetical protein